jgi:hypothetical protein
MNSFEFASELTIDKAAEYLGDICSCRVDKYLTTVRSEDSDADRTSGVGVYTSANESEHFDSAAKRIASEAHSYFLSASRPDKAPVEFRNSDQQLYTDWFGLGWGKNLLDRLKCDGVDCSPHSVFQSMRREPEQFHEYIKQALTQLAPTDGASSQNIDDWNEGISELAGLYALSLLDYEIFSNPALLNKTSDLLYVSFPKGEYQSAFQACVTNATRSGARLQVRPPLENDPSKSPSVPGLFLTDVGLSAGSGVKTPEREFVETLYWWAYQRDKSSCPGSDEDHATGMSEQERGELRDRVNLYQDRYGGPGSLVLIIDKAKFTSGKNWWESWSQLLAALNDGVIRKDDKVKLRGIVLKQPGQGALVTMHPKYGRRLAALKDMLERYYRS